MAKSLLQRIGDFLGGASQAAKNKVEEAAQQQTGAAARTYVVKSGDTLSGIAKSMYGDAGRWPAIFEANKDKISDPNLIHPGQELRIP
jgi:nucleoid-associated protein YgaU